MVNSFIFLKDSVSDFNFYGFFIGLSLVLAWWILEIINRKLRVQLLNYNLMLTVLLLGSIIGARLWHVLTSWQNYQNQAWSILAVWHGGLSIWGAIWGGLIFLSGYFYWWQNKNWRKFWIFLDILVFVLPPAQALGRLGNWFNQELYGLPTNLPWAIYIDPQHRLSGFENQAFYHPLFLYEALGLMIFGFFYYFFLFRNKLRLGQGKYFVFYLIFYTVLRFCLEFLRIDKPMFEGFVYLSVNQVLSVMLLLTFLIICKFQKNGKMVRAYI